MAVRAAEPEHPQTTRRGGLRYIFATKHHGAGYRDAAVWSPELTSDDEFAVFDDADYYELADDRGYYYGIRLTADGLSELGTWGQQVAEFPRARENEPWHGYPLWPLQENAPDPRKNEKHRPDKVVFVKMERAGLLSKRDTRRLMGGHHL